MINIMIIMIITMTMVILTIDITTIIAVNNDGS